MAERSALWVERLTLAAAALGSLLTALYRIRTHDTFFHLATGRAIVELGAVPRTDIFSFTVRGAPWTNHSAGFQWLIYRLHQACGFAGLSLWQALLSLALFALGASAVERAQRPYACAVGLLPFVFYREVLEARPHALGFVCLALTLRLARRPALSWRAGLAFFATYALFCVVHGSHLLALFVCALAAAFALGRRDFAALRGWALLFLSCLTLAAILQPDAFGQGLQHLSSEFLEGNVAEWRPLTPSDLATSDKGIVYLACFALALMGSVAAVRAPSGEPTSPLSLTLLGIFMLLSLTSRRMLALFLFGAAPLWLPLAGRAADLLTERLHAWWRRALVATALALLLAHLFLAEAPYVMGAGLDAPRFPSGAVERLRRPDAPQRVYNAYNFGAYLIWTRTPSAGVFVDGRAITVYPPEFLAAFERAYDDAGMFEQLCARFAIDGVLMPHASPRVQRLLAHLAASPHWSELYRDELSVLYAARAPH
jgi:hypothetical protein